ncbi:KTSC domain-containing protein [Paenibacillus naphthalenovorans]|uniref:KTSC domain-containing protein n=1 Tax=Paenibacillus naphthalenovorans TaxID=162209 RepID=UPI003D2C6D03
MIMEKVQSSNIAAVGYDEEARELHIQFHSGGTYAYKAVPRVMYQAMMELERKQGGSVGKFYHANIKKQFEGVKVEEKVEAHE